MTKDRHSLCRVMESIDMIARRPIISLAKSRVYVLRLSWESGMFGLFKDEIWRYPKTLPFIRMLDSHHIDYRQPTATPCCGLSTFMISPKKNGISTLSLLASMCPNTERLFI